MQRNTAVSTVTTSYYLRSESSKIRQCKTMDQHIFHGSVLFILKDANERLKEEERKVSFSQSQ